jgi:serine/threonine-protein kinase HipA
MKLTFKLTNDFNELEKLYRLMCFNIYAHNRDDHSKNFTFIYNKEQNRWSLSPAYDLTYSNSIGGEHATSINGNGRNPGIDDILAVANEIKLGNEKAKRIAKEIEETVKHMLPV